MAKKNSYCYIILFVLTVASICLADSNLPYKEGELLVRFMSKADGKQKNIDEKNQILSSLNAGEVKHSYKRVSGLTLVKLPENLAVADALPKFFGKDEIIYAEPNWKMKLRSNFPNDTNFTNNNLWGLHNIGQIVNNVYSGKPDADIDAPEAWSEKTDASSVTVAGTGQFLFILL